MLARAGPEIGNSRNVEFRAQWHVRERRDEREEGGDDGLVIVSLPQHLLCSFEGTAFLIGVHYSPVQVCNDRGGVSFISNTF